MMMPLSVDMKDFTAQPSGLHGALDGGASCMALGHETLMHYIEHYHKLGFQTESTIRLPLPADVEDPPVRRRQNFGSRMDSPPAHLRRRQLRPSPGCGSCPPPDLFLIIGRSILKALKLHGNEHQETTRDSNETSDPIRHGRRRHNTPTCADRETGPHPKATTNNNNNNNNNRHCTAKPHPLRI